MSGPHPNAREKRKCLDCPVMIPALGNKKRCPDCQENIRRIRKNKSAKIRSAPVSP